jgi:hypothetical protein
MAISRAPEEVWLTAVHEAAHAVVNYRAAGFGGGAISIVGDPVKGTLGQAIDAVSDGLSAQRTEARIISCFAGEYAQCRVNPETGDDGCGADQAIARDLMVQYGWVHRQSEFRNRSQQYVESHWAEIEAVARELVTVKELDDTEVELLSDIAAGKLSPTDLEQYRMNRVRLTKGEGK